MEEKIVYKEIKGVSRTGAEANADTLHLLIQELESDGYEVFEGILTGDTIKAAGSKVIDK